MRMAWHVRLLAWFHIVVCSIGLLIAGVIFALGSALPALLSRIGGEAADLPAAVVQLMVVAVAGIVGALSLPGLVLGYGLYNLRSWARVFGLVMSAFELLNVPFGTALAVYSFWVLLKPETEALFRYGQPAPPQ